MKETIGILFAVASGICFLIPSLPTLALCIIFGGISCRLLAPHA